MISEFRNKAFRLRKNLIQVFKGLALRLSIYNILPRKKRLLILKLDSIGDYLLFRNFLIEIRGSEKYRDYEITLCGNVWWQSFSTVMDKKEVDRFVWVDYSKLGEEVYLNGVVRNLRSMRFETAICPTFSRSLFADTILLECGAKFKIAQSGDTVNIHPDQKEKHDKRLSTLVPSKESLSFEFERNRVFFRQVLNKKDIVDRPSLPVAGKRVNRVLVCPGAKVVARQWKPQYFYELCHYLSKKLNQPEFVICGSAAESRLAEQIMASGEEIKFKDLTGKIDLVELSKLISESALLLCNDSAPYHMGALLNTPLVCLSNGNHYGRFCPYPKEYDKPNLEMFPRELENITPDQIAELQQHGSFLDINSISPADVITQIEKKGFLNEIIHHHH